jgi:hypothetical protein
MLDMSRIARGVGARIRVNPLGSGRGWRALGRTALGVVDPCQSLRHAPFRVRRACVPRPTAIDPVLRQLLRRRVEIYTWLDSPAKQAHLAAVNRMIERHRRESARAA